MTIPLRAHGVKRKNKGNRFTALSTYFGFSAANGAEPNRRFVAVNAGPDERLSLLRIALKSASKKGASKTFSPA